MRVIEPLNMPAHQPTVFWNHGDLAVESRIHSE
jgi:hypothetical protein